MPRRSQLLTPQTYKCYNSNTTQRKVHFYGTVLALARHMYPNRQTARHGRFDKSEPNAWRKSAATALLVLGVASAGFSLVSLRNTTPTPTTTKHQGGEHVSLARTPLDYFPRLGLHKIISLHAAFVQRLAPDETETVVQATERTSMARQAAHIRQTNERTQSHKSPVARKHQVALIVRQIQHPIELANSTRTEARQ
jgi:hypothetical protein